MILFGQPLHLLKIPDHFNSISRPFLLHGRAENQLLSVSELNTSPGRVPLTRRHSSTTNLVLSVSRCTRCAHVWCQCLPQQKGRWFQFQQESGALNKLATVRECYVTVPLKASRKYPRRSVCPFSWHLEEMRWDVWSQMESDYGWLFLFVCEILWVCDSMISDLELFFGQGAPTPCQSSRRGHEWRASCQHQPPKPKRQSPCPPVLPGTATRQLTLRHLLPTCLQWLSAIYVQSHRHKLWECSQRDIIKLKYHELMTIHAACKFKFKYCMFLWLYDAVYISSLFMPRFCQISGTTRVITSTYQVKTKSLYHYIIYHIISTTMFTTMFYHVTSCPVVRMIWMWMDVDGCGVVSPCISCVFKWTFSGSTSFTMAFLENSTGNSGSPPRFPPLQHDLFKIVSGCFSYFE